MGCVFRYGVDTKVPKGKWNSLRVEGCGRGHHRQLVHVKQQHIAREQVIALCIRQRQMTLRVAKAAQDDWRSQRPRAGICGDHS